MSSQSLKEAPRNFIGRVPTTAKYEAFKVKQNMLFNMDYVQDKSPHTFFKSDRLINKSITGLIVFGLCLTAYLYVPKYLPKKK